MRVRPEFTFDILRPNKMHRSFVLLFVEKGQFTFDISPNVLLAKRFAQTFCIFRTKCSAIRLEPNNSHGPNVLHKRSFAQTTHADQEGPGSTRAGRRAPWCICWAYWDQEAEDCSQGEEGGSTLVPG